MTIRCFIKLIATLCYFFTLAVPPASYADEQTTGTVQDAMDALRETRYRLADTIFRQVLEDQTALPPDIYYHAAAAAFGSGHYKRAETLIIQYLQQGESLLYNKEALTLKTSIADAISAFALSDKAAFEFAQKQHTIFAYAAYHRSYPDGENIAAADTLSYSRAKEVNTEIVYQRYIDLWPDGRFLPDAQRAADTAAMRVARKQNTIKSYQAYQASYPNGMFKDQARDREQSLAFFVAQKDGSVTAIKEFLALYPVSSYRVEAARTLKEAEEKAPLRDLIGQTVVIPAGIFAHRKPTPGKPPIEGNIVHINNSLQAMAFETTFDQWGACVAAGGCNGYSPDDMGWGRENRPVINVSHDDIQAYIEWLNGRWHALGGKGDWHLPSEAEWVYLARGQNTMLDMQRTAFGNANKSCADCKTLDATDMTFPVGQYKANSFGLYDILGNVAEWVADCWQDDFMKAPTDGSAWQPEGGACTVGTVRGTTDSAMPAALAAQARQGIDKTARAKNMGFRLVLTHIAGQVASGKR